MQLCSTAAVCVLWSGCVNTADSHTCLLEPHGRSGVFTLMTPLDSDLRVMNAEPEAVVFRAG